MDCWGEHFAVLEGHHLAEFEGCTAHAGELFDETLDVGGTEHDAGGGGGAEARGALEGFGGGSPGHAGCETAVVENAAEAGGGDAGGGHLEGGLVERDGGLVGCGERGWWE